jgi:large subunit ribosomal protein L35
MRQKLKTKKGVAKRFRMTKSGKLKYKPCKKSHLLTNKRPDRLRKLRRDKVVKNKKLEQFVKALVPYGI